MDSRYFKSAENFYGEMATGVNDVNIDNQSLFYKQNMPVSQELSYITILLDETLKRARAKSCLENGYYDDLKEICGDMGVFATESTTATGIIKLTGNPNSIFPQGSLVSTKGGMTYKTDSKAVINSNGEAYVTITASDLGSKYNCKAGEIVYFPVTFSGILTVTNTEEIKNGYDEETPEHLYDRYLFKLQHPSTSGNKYDYENWAIITGVGDAKCLTADDLGEGGKVKVIICDANKRKADEDLVKKVKEHIDAERPVLSGDLEVVSVKEIDIDIQAKIEIDSNSTIEKVKAEYEDLLKAYFNDKVYSSKKISIAKIQALLIDINSVIDVDVDSVKVNNDNKNINLEIDEVAVLNSITLEVI